ncbi:peptide deformylase [Flammeovirga kamogawensis]|uniref:Peptide deformylase n=1 Tax=Flammeovirga kamogawensis TaxID=373891 RepID=A0ABX8GXK1_9BACT|nr:peptide deformylase [Flammeovirga kamogawensis]MBB6461104.1 peptide deformylase [Flammeovirga kamogawensis]QWG07670.1 peptide deformylase [Flammeovirga kamogawensis]TRX69480.1 peptide deformylase [Flammeovirga kamogawensis]
MIYPVVAYGDPILRKVAKDFSEEELKDVKTLAADMFETMEGASGVGLAGPQIGIAKRIFVIDSNLMIDEESKEQGLRSAFINAEVIEEFGEECGFDEGCLSIPGINGEVVRKESIKIKYLDEELNEKEEVYSGMTARVIQHEYDHIEGKLFTDYLSPIKKRLIKSKLNNITKGKANHSYRMRFPKK